MHNAVFITFHYITYVSANCHTDDWDFIVENVYIIVIRINIVLVRYDRSVRKKQSKTRGDIHEIISFNDFGKRFAFL